MMRGFRMLFQKEKSSQLTRSFSRVKKLTCAQPGAVAEGGCATRPFLTHEMFRLPEAAAEPVPHPALPRQASASEDSGWRVVGEDWCTEQRFWMVEKKYKARAVIFPTVRLAQ